ncbi:MAG: sortase [bacterium]|nr:sortase [bacterium]
MKYHLIQFHDRAIIVAPDHKAGKADALAITSSSAFIRPSRFVMGIFGVALLMLSVAVVYGYGRTLWAHAVYYASEARVMLAATDGEHAQAQGYAEAAVLETPAPVMLPIDDSVRQVPDATASPVPQPAPSDAKGSVQAAAPVKKKTPAKAAVTIGELYIARIGVRTPVVVSDTSLQAINGALAHGVVQWPGSANAGEGGTTVILGHSSAPLSYRGKYGAVFSLLEKLEPGDVITIQAPGALYTYTVRDQVILDPKKEQPDLLKQDGETLVLVSCWPVGTNWQRIVIRADRNL